MPKVSGSRVPSSSSAPYYYADAGSPSASSPDSSSDESLKKKHLCDKCPRAFATSGHLARHTRVHTGERNHKCPFPGCETRCSRQDNLQQHYRIHLSPGSRRSSNRSALARGSVVPIVSATLRPEDYEDASPPPSFSRLYEEEAPDSPPALVHCTLPRNSYPQSSTSHSDRSTASPDPWHNHHTQAVTMTMKQYPQVPASFRDEKPIIHYTTTNTAAASTSTYPPSSQLRQVQPQPLRSQLTQQHGFQYASSSNSSRFSSPLRRSVSPPNYHVSSISSRHSISSASSSYSSYQHQSYSQASTAASSPTSSAPVSPITPYMYHDSAQAYTPHNVMVQQGQGLGVSHISSTGHLVHNAYSAQQPQLPIPSHPSLMMIKRQSPAPILAPIGGYGAPTPRDTRYQQQQQQYPIIHQPQPISSNDYRLRLNTQTQWKDTHFPLSKAQY